MLIGNKLDLFLNRVVSYEEACLVAIEIGVYYIEASAKIILI